MTNLFVSRRNRRSDPPHPSEVSEKNGLATVDGKRNKIKTYERKRKTAKERLG